MIYFFNQPPGKQKQKQPTHTLSFSQITPSLSLFELQIKQFRNHQKMLRLKFNQVSLVSGILQIGYGLNLDINPTHLEVTYTWLHKVQFCVI